MPELILVAIGLFGGLTGLPGELLVPAVAAGLLANSAPRIVERIEIVQPVNARRVAGQALAIFSFNSMAIASLAYFVGLAARLTLV